MLKDVKARGAEPASDVEQDVAGVGSRMREEECSWMAVVTL